MCGMKITPIPFGRHRPIASSPSYVIMGLAVDQGCSASTPTVRKSCPTGEVGIQCSVIVQYTSIVLV